MATQKFWSRSFIILFAFSALTGLVGGLYFLLIAGLTERSNPIGSVFSTVGVILLLLPWGLLLARRLLLKERP